MAAQRPVTLVFQEFATLSSSPATPELNCLITGPSYWIQDFPEDREDIQIADYGIAPGAAATGVSVVTTAVTVADAPNNQIGAVLDTASVRVFTSETQVELLVAADMTTTPLTPNVGSVAFNFTTSGVKLLDTIVMTDTAGPTTITRTIVGPTDAEGVFNGVNALVLNSEIPAGFSATAVKYRIERTLTESEIDDSFYTFVPATNTITVDALATLPIGVAQKRIVSCELYVAYRSLRTDLEDLKTLGSVNEIEGQLGRIDSRNPLAVGLSVALQNTNTTVQYFGIGTDDLAGYTSMKDSIAGRKDIYAVVPLAQDILVLAMLKAEFVALADPDYALTNGVPQKFRVAIGQSTELPTTKIVIDVNTNGGTEVQASLPVPTTEHTLTLTGQTLITAGVLPGDTLIITADATAATGTLTSVGAFADGETVTIGTQTYTFRSPFVNAANNIDASGTQAQTHENLRRAINGNGVAGTNYGTGTLVNTSVTALDTATTNVLTAIIPGTVGNSIVTTETCANASFGAATLTGGLNVTRNGTYTVAQVLSQISLELDTELPGGVQSHTGTVNIKVGTTIADRLAATVIIPLVTVVDAKLYIDLYDPNGTFVDDGVIPTDVVEMPKNPTQSSFTAMDSFVVASIVSNERLRIVNNGRSTSLVANELPHGASRNAPVTAIPATNTLYYRVMRTLDKAGQVTELVAVTQSIASRRVVDVWPDLCDVGGLVDGSLPRDPLAPTTAQPAATQPGYYLACAVGGMTAGLPSHQGFTNLGIAGVTKIYNSNTYFSDKNITDISNGGWFVFQQDTPAALPYCVHQLTTDVSTLQSGEYSMVKNFDFVSLFFADILDDYLGIWNINKETMGFISSAVTGGIDNLKLRRRPRIGSPIIDGKITNIYVSPSSADRIELFVEVQMPAPLNIIALHLVSA